MVESTPSRVSRFDPHELDLGALEARLRTWGETSQDAHTIARRIWRWLYRAGITNADQMTDLSPRVQQRLANEMRWEIPAQITEIADPDGSTRKVLLQMSDHAQVETVLLQYRKRYTVCVSTQVGCPCGCVFCATGQMGFVRQLSVGEILAQVMHFHRRLVARGERVSNVVFMGMGEPLLNEAETIKALKRLVDPRGFGIAPSRVTLSTVGIVPGIVHLAAIHQLLPINLALSLHATTDELRSKLLPMNDRYPLGDLAEAVRYYVSVTGRRVLFEWIMIDGVNDSPEHAEGLVAWLEGIPAHVNLIQLNPTPAFHGKPASPQAWAAFVAVLDRYGIPHTVRQSKGASISAGCGQLRAGQRLGARNAPAV